MTDIIVTTPKTEMKTAAQEAVDIQQAGGGQYFRAFQGRRPDINPGERVYYTEDGFLRGYATVTSVEHAEKICETTGRFWRGLIVTMDATSWTWIKPTPFPGFRGYQYARFAKEPEAVGNWLDPKPDTPMTTQMGKESLLRILSCCWKKDTSSDPDGWTIHNPAWGQSAITAAIVQDYLGGEIVWSPVLLSDGRTISHYYNQIDSAIIDFTGRQFPLGTSIPEPIARTGNFATTRQYILSYPQTEERYRRLKKRVERKRVHF